MCVYDIVYIIHVYTTSLHLTNYKAISNRLNHTYTTCILT